MKCLLGSVRRRRENCPARCFGSPIGGLVPVFLHREVPDQLPTKPDNTALYRLRHAALGHNGRDTFLHFLTAEAMMGGRGIAEPSEQELAPGPHRDLVLAVRALYRAAGFPSARSIADGIRDGDFPALMNHQLVSEFLRGRTLSSLAKVHSLAMYLAGQQTPRQDPDETRTYFTALWDQAFSVAISTGGRPPARSLADAHRSGATAALPALPPARAARHSPDAEASATPQDARYPLLALALADLDDARVAHGGLSIEEAERLSGNVYEMVHHWFIHQIAATKLPLEIEPRELQCTFGDLPYRTMPGQNSFKIHGFARGVNIEITPVIGISRDRADDHPYIVFDANVHKGDALRLTLDDAQGAAVLDPDGTLAHWVERKLASKIKLVADAERARVSGLRP